MVHENLRNKHDSLFCSHSIKSTNYLRRILLSLVHRFDSFASANMLGDRCHVLEIDRSYARNRSRCGSANQITPRKFVLRFSPHSFDTSPQIFTNAIHEVPSRIIGFHLCGSLAQEDVQRSTNCVRFGLTAAFLDHNRKSTESPDLR